MTTPRAARVETPADTLRRAAKHVRKLGAAATPGPWERALKTRTKSAIMALTPHDAEFHQRGREHVVICSVPEFSAGAGFVRARSGRDLDWIATLGPQVAEPLAAWLDQEAGQAFCDASLLHSHRNRYFPHEVVTDADLWEQAERKQGHALALARALLGSPVPVPDGEGT